MIDLADVIRVVEALANTSMIIMTGLYFVFSNTIMKALKNTENGPEVMVEINKVILNPLFMGGFILSGVASLWFAVAGSGLMMLSGAVFFIGTTLVTIIKNVPLNNRLRDAIEAATTKLVWREYLNKWVFWNHVRSVSAVISGFLMVL